MQVEINQNNKFHEGKIYKIVSPSCTKFYIGSTTKPLEQRLKGHESQYKSFKKGSGSTYVSSYDILKYNDYYIKLIKDVKCETREELHKAEGEIQRQFFDQLINKYKAGRTQDELNAYFAKYKIEHHDRVLESLKKSYHKKITCVCGLVIARGNKTHHLRSKLHLNQPFTNNDIEV